MAYQIGFDLYESATQDLLSHVRQGLRTTAPVPSLLKDVDAVTSTSTTSAAPAEGSTSGTNEDEEMATPQTEEENADTAMSEEKTLDDLVISAKVFCKYLLVIVVCTILYVYY